MASNLSLEQSVDKMFDDLVKSRFIEIFGDVLTNEKGWKSSTLGSISDVTSSRRVFSQDFVNEGIPFYRGSEIADLSLNGYTVPQYYITHDLYESLIAVSGKPEVGDILLPSICSKGELWVVDTKEPFYIKDGRVLWIKVNQTEINSLFLKYMLKEYIVNNFSSMASGSTFAEMKIFLLKDIPVIMPPLELQEKFVSFIDQVDKSKFIYKQLVSKYDGLVKSRFIEMFGNPIKNDKGWIVQPLSSLCDKLCNGSPLPNGNTSYVKNGAIYLQSSNVWRGFFDFSELHYIPLKDEETISDTRIRYGDILITRTGRINTPDSSLARIAMYRDELGPVNISNAMFLVRLKSGISPLFVQYCLLSEPYREYIKGCCPGGTDKRNLYIRYVEQFPIILPPVELQNKFAHFVQQVDKSKRMMLDSVHSLLLSKEVII